jgi:hypothetical protein
MSLDSEYWNNRYAQHQTGWDMGMPSPPLMEYLRSSVSKEARILIPGAGNAWEAAQAFREGYHKLFVIDWAPKARELFLKRYPDFPEEQYLCGDFFLLNHRFDFILEQTFFCALDPELRTNYVKKMVELLTPGGVLAGVWFDVEMEGGPPYGGGLAEYIERFSPYFHIRKAEPCYNSIAARKGREVFLILVARTRDKCLDSSKKAGS